MKEKYTFTDADGGPAGEESEDEVDPDDLADLTPEQEGEEEGEEEEGEEAEEAMEDSEDEEDDTADRMAACGEAPEEPPDGYVYAPICPPLLSLDDKRALVGKKVLTARIDDGACGWFLGTVTSSAVGVRDKKKVPTATHVVAYTKKETGTNHLRGLGCNGALKLQLRQQRVVAAARPDYIVRFSCLWPSGRSGHSDPCSDHSDRSERSGHSGHSVTTLAQAALSQQLRDRCVMCTSLSLSRVACAA